MFVIIVEHTKLIIIVVLLFTSRQAHICIAFRAKYEIDRSGIGQFTIVHICR